MVVFIRLCLSVNFVFVSFFLLHFLCLSDLLLSIPLTHVFWAEGIGSIPFHVVQSMCFLSWAVLCQNKPIDCCFGPLVQSLFELYNIRGLKKFRSKKYSVLIHFVYTFVFKWGWNGLTTTKMQLYLWKKKCFIDKKEKRVCKIMEWRRPKMIVLRARLELA